MLKFISFLSILFGLLISFPLHAALVKYVVNGQLDHLTDRDYYYQTD